ncbi:MAG TPA: hypothetical protein VF887_01245 [Gemmatimonadaceae bacterium]
MRSSQLPYAGTASHGIIQVELTPQPTTTVRRPGTKAWQSIQPDLATRLTDQRLQLHYAAQFATAAGISFLPHEQDDSHTNLEWLPEFSGLFSRLIPAKKPFRIGVRPIELALLIVPEPRTTIAECKLNRCTIADTLDWIRPQIASQGADPNRYTLERHYELPFHPVASGGAFDSSERSRFEELSKWLSNGAIVLSELARSISGASEVRCWPHHFDMGTLIPVGADRSIGVGLEPGDKYYDEPYFYVNMNPQPSVPAAQSRPLSGEGSWHVNEWVGAVLPGSRLGPASSQRVQVGEFLDSAISVARQLIDRS